jgi:hypothetical protein
MEKLAQLSPKSLSVAGLVTGAVLQSAISGLQAANDNDEPEPPPVAAAPIPRIRWFLLLVVSRVVGPPLLRAAA